MTADFERTRAFPLVPELAEALACGADVLDVGCGGGRALARLALIFPNSRFHGVDASLPAIESARREACARGLGNVRFDASDPAALDEPDRFDLITAFAIHREPAPSAVLARIASALRPDGAFLMQEAPAAGARSAVLWGPRAAQRLLAEAGFGSVEALALPHASSQLYYVARKARPL